MLAGGRELSAIVHRPGLLDDPALAAEIADAARLALEHERLGAIRRAQLESLRASRARIVATADAERRALERDLHDGAQQRLATLAVASGWHAGSWRHARPALDAELGAAEEELRAGARRAARPGPRPDPRRARTRGARRPRSEALADRTPRLVVARPARRALRRARRVGGLLPRRRDAAARRRRRRRWSPRGVTDGRLLVELDTVAGDRRPDHRPRGSRRSRRRDARRDAATELRAELPCAS